MKPKFQLHLNGKDRVNYTFETIDAALNHQGQLIMLCQSRINYGQPRSREYLEEARSLKVVEVGYLKSVRIFSVVEYTDKGTSVVKNYSDKGSALSLITKLEDYGTRRFSVVETRINGQR